MGIIKCKIHGIQGFYEVCEHIWEDFQKGVIPEMKDVPVFSTKICVQCYIDYNVKELGNRTFEDILELPEDEQIKFEEKIGIKYGNLNRRIICIECLNKLRIIDAKKSGKELPFEPFENTLMHKDEKTIKELKEMLTSNYEFQNFKMPYINTLKAFHITGGGISYPFSIKFYYVTRKEDQNKLLKLIDNFFKEIPRKQRKISFYEAENWIIEKDGNKTNEYKGEEKLLLERIVK